MAMGTGHVPHNRRRERQRPFSDINVTPMVDVMLVLLVIFMVTAPLMTQGVTVDLPAADAPPVAGQDEPLTISIDSSGRVYIQKTPVEANGLGVKLTAVAGAKKDTRIFVRGDKSVDYGRIMQVVGQINGAGFTKVALITEAGQTAPDKGR